MVRNGLDGPGLGRHIEECPNSTVEPGQLTPLDESASESPQMPLPDPHPTSDLHRAAFGGNAGGPIPEVGVPNTPSNYSPVLSFGSALSATQSLEGVGLEEGYWGANMDPREPTVHSSTSPACDTQLHDHTSCAASLHCSTTFTASLVGAKDLLGDVGESPCLYSQWAGAACTGNAHTNRDHCCQSTKTSASATLSSVGSGLFPLLTWSSRMAKSRELRLYDVNSAPPPCLHTQMSSPSWLATSRFSLVPDQGGVTWWRNDLLADFPDAQSRHPQLCSYVLRLSFGSPGPLDWSSHGNISSMMSRFWLKSPDGHEEDAKDNLQLGIGSDPGECQFWPFDPGPFVQYSGQPISSIWQVTCVSPGQYGNFMDPSSPSRPLKCFPLSSFYAGDREYHRVWKSIFGEVRGGSGRCQYTPFDPGSLGDRDSPIRTLRGLTPFECPLQHEFIVATSCLPVVTRCYSHRVLTCYMKISLLRLSEVKSRTPDCCITLAVCQLHSRPSRSQAQLLGFVLMQSSNSLPRWCLHLFQASAKQPEFQEPDLGLKGSWKSTAGQADQSGKGASDTASRQGHSFHEPRTLSDRLEPG